MKYEELIDNYLLGRMTKEEEEGFLAECKVNTELRNEARMMALLIKVIRKNENKN